MENSLAHVAIVGSAFTDVYTSSGVLVGTKISIQNIGPSLIQVYLGTSPENTKGEIIRPFEFYIVAAGVTGCFVKTNNGQTSQIAIQPRPYNTLGSPIDERVYTGYKALTVQSFTESNSKNGTQFEFSYESDSVAAGANLDMIFQTDGIPILIKNRQISFTGERVSASVYKNTTFTGGTNLVLHNLNTDLMLPTFCTAKTGITVTNVGTLVSATPTTHGSAGQGNRVIGTYAVGGAERVLALNSTYLLRVTNNDSSACRISVYITYYEGEISSQN